MARISRRGFLERSTGAAAAGAVTLAAAQPRPRAASSPNEKIIVGVMGFGGRGGWLARAFSGRPDVEIAAIADPVSSRFDARVQTIAKAQNREPKIVADFRRLLDDPNIDAIVNATPDHWHCPGTVFACQAGKDVYVEKPASYNIWEGRKAVEAARKYERVVQLGTQTRSAAYAQHAVEYLRSGKLGDIHLIRVYNMKTRGQIPPRPDGQTPQGVDYNLWCGPAELKPYNPNYVSQWNWFWNFSGGDIINDGVHHIDLARWLGGLTSPKSAVSTGGIFHFKDAGETPDTQLVEYEFDRLAFQVFNTLWTPYMPKIAQEIRQGDLLPHWPSCATRIEVYGTKGMMYVGRHGGGWQVFGDEWVNDKEVAHEYGREPSEAHIANFCECVRSRKRPNADIEEGHISTILCHLGNISSRLGNRQLRWDGKTETFVGDEEANRLLKRPVQRAPFGIPEKV